MLDMRVGGDGCGMGEGRNIYFPLLLTWLFLVSEASFTPEALSVYSVFLLEHSQ